MRHACRDLLERTDQLAGPIRLSPLCRAVGAELEEADLAVDGLLSAYGDRYVIQVRSREDVGWRRARFSIAHEIGHILLFDSVGEGQVSSVSDPGYVEAIESLCNLAAAELLMPSWHFQQEALNAGFDSDGLSYLRQCFGVSWSALLVRFVDVFPDAGATIWRSGVRAGDGDKMRVVKAFGRQRQSWLAPGMSERFLSEPLPRRALLDGSAVCKGVRVLRSSESPKLLGLASRIDPERRQGKSAAAVLLLPPAAESSWKCLASRGAATVEDSEDRPRNNSRKEPSLQLALLR